MEATVEPLQWCSPFQKAVWKNSILTCFWKDNIIIANPVSLGRLFHNIGAITDQHLLWPQPEGVSYLKWRQEQLLENKYGRPAGAGSWQPSESSRCEAKAVMKLSAISLAKWYFSGIVVRVADHQLIFSKAKHKVFPSEIPDGGTSELLPSGSFSSF